MTITIKILQAEYKDGFVYVMIGKPAAAVVPVTVRNVAELDAEVQALRSAWAGNIDGQIYLPSIVTGRKIPGYDAYRHNTLNRDVRRVAVAGNTVLSEATLQ